MAISHQKSSEPSVTGRLSQKLGGASSSVLLYAGVAAVLTGYAVYPSKSNPLYPAIFLSYSIPANNDSERTQYGKGPKDLIFVAFYTLVLFAARDFVREHVGRALSRSLGIKDEDRQFKFIQQLWQAVYFGWIACFGLYVMRGLPLWFFNMPGLFEGFPHKTLDGPFKVFYLVHSGNWIQQALVTFIPLEEARNDNWVMVTHHIITLSAIPLVYTWHLTHFALALIIPHDISDSILASGKCISYADPHPGVQMGYFSIFVGSWIYFRHYVGGITFWTLLTKYKPAITGAYHWEDQQWKATLLHGAIVALFGALQILNIYWLSLILKIAAKAISGGIPKDEREEDGEVENKTKAE